MITLERESLIARGLRLEYLTLGYNAVEALVAIASGMLASSVALIGFGIDSLIEVTSGAAVIWRLRGDRSERENVSLRVIGACFLMLAAYVACESVEALWKREAPERSLPGILLASASVIVMPLLARAKRRVAAGLSSGAMRADAKQTELCSWLSAILLGGLGLNALFGWWWADPVAALAMVPIIAKEGRDALSGRHCGCGTCHQGPVQSL